MSKPSALLTLTQARCTAMYFIPGFPVGYLRLAFEVPPLTDEAKDAIRLLWRYGVSSLRQSGGPLKLGPCRIISLKSFEGRPKRRGDSPTTHVSVAVDPPPGIPADLQSYVDKTFTVKFSGL